VRSLPGRARDHTNEHRDGRRHEQRDDAREPERNARRMRRLRRGRSRNGLPGQRAAEGRHRCRRSGMHMPCGRRSRLPDRAMDHGWKVRRGLSACDGDRGPAADDDPGASRRPSDDLNAGGVGLLDDGLRRRRRGGRRRRRRLGLGDHRRGRRRRRRRRGRRRRLRSGLSGGLRGRRARAGRQERKRVEIALRIRGHPDSEVHGRPRRRNGRSLADGRSLHDAERAQVRQRDRVSVGRLDRQRHAAARHRAGEADGAGGRRRDRLTLHCADLDPAALARGVRVRAVERERLEHRPPGRPGPGLRRGGKREEHGGGEQEAAHRKSPLLSYLKTERAR
jgi:hypothetical protein